MAKTEAYVRAEAFQEFSERIDPALEAFTKSHDRIMTHAARINQLAPRIATITAPLAQEWKDYLVDLVEVLGSLATGLVESGEAKTLLGETLVQLADEALERARDV